MPAKLPRGILPRLCRRIASRVENSGLRRSACTPHASRDRSASEKPSTLDGSAVAGHRDLLALLVQVVERVQELVLEPRPRLEELDVVEQQHVDVAVLPPERLERLPLRRHRVLAPELLGRRVHHAQAPPRRLVADGVEQVRLSEPTAAEDDDRVRPPRLLRRRVRRPRGQRILLADDEGLERQGRVEVRPPEPRSCA